MSTTSVVVLVVAVVVVLVLLALLGWAAQRRNRTTQMRDRFGEEYDRTVADAGSRREAERDLSAREQRHEQMELRPLLPDEQERYARQWGDAQAMFVDDPKRALARADDLVQTVMERRGYPTDGDFEQRASDLSVEHSDVLSSYRSAHEVSEHTADGTATTEEMRRGMTQYRELVTALLDRPGS
jgi:hypothetical protein